VTETWEDYFPYKIRPAQRIIVNSISKLISKQKNVVLEAANGTGKTVATLCAVLPYAKKYGKKIVYMARTHSQMDRVMEELTEVSNKQSVSGIVMRSRSSMCLNKLLLEYATDNRSANEICKQLKKSKKCSYYSNMMVDSKLLPVLRALEEQPATTELIFEMAERQAICPAEIARKALRSVDVVACSYLYIFDPQVRSSFLEMMEVEMNDIILVIDEAHNLPETALNIDSDSISTFTFTRAVREASRNARSDLIPFFEASLEVLKKHGKGIKTYDEKVINGGQFFEDIELQLEGVNFDLEDYEDELAESFFAELIEVGQIIRSRMAKANKEPNSSIGKLGEFFDFLYRSIAYESFITTIEKQAFKDGKRDTYDVLRTTSLDSRTVTLEPLSDCHLSVHISGTIGDPDAYLRLTGLEKLDTAANLLPSPYSRSNVAVYVTKKISSIYSHRNSQLYREMVDIILAVIENTPGNIGVFAPSYLFLKEIMSHGLEQKSRKPIYEVRQRMKSQENEVLIRRFKREASRGGAVLCAVLGGRSSEGTDFKGDLMNAVCVVGMPYAPPGARINAHIEYLNTQFANQGRALGYIMPAVNRASQAAGRAVRSLSDKAFITLLDFRYLQRNNSVFLPEWMRENMQAIEPDPQLLGEKVRKFFRDR